MSHEFLFKENEFAAKHREKRMKEGYAGEILTEGWLRKQSNQISPPISKKPHKKGSSLGPANGLEAFSQNQIHRRGIATSNNSHRVAHPSGQNQRFLSYWVDLPALKAYPQKKTVG